MAPHHRTHYSPQSVSCRSLQRAQRSLLWSSGSLLLVPGHTALIFRAAPLARVVFSVCTSHSYLLAVVWNLSSRWETESCPAFIQFLGTAPDSQ